MDKELLWIGPSKCDEQRTARETELERAWDKLISTTGFKETYLLLGSAIDLFREALSCYQNGAYMATVIMCRACIEASVYILTSRETKYRDDWKKIVEVKIKYDLMGSKWKQILRKARMNQYVDEELERQLKEIREAGNFAAHYGQRYDRELTRIRKEVEGKEGEEMRSWTKRNEALGTLYGTGNVLGALISKALEKHDSSIE